MLDVRLLFDAPPHGHPGCRLYPGASQDLAVALYLHKQHTYTYNIQKHIAKCRSHIQLYLPIKYYTKCSSFQPQILGIN
jgi:hypothetical protein